MIKITKYYSEQEINRYYQFLLARNPEKKVANGTVIEKIDSVGNKVVELLNKLPKKNRGSETISDFKELITMNFSKLKKFYSSLNLNNEDYIDIINDENNQEVLNTYKGYYSKFFTNNDGSIKTKNNISLIKDLGITVCPYCNRNYINSRHDKVGCEFDHYYNKDDYPFFALTLSNLIPSCSTCNRVKGKKDYKFCPFDLEKKENVEFRVSPPSDSSKIELLFDKKSQSSNILQLETAYEIHKIDVDEMFMREQKYCKEYREYLTKLFEGKGELETEISDDFFDNMIFGEIANDSFSDYLNISLAKLKKDTYNYIVQLREE